MLQLKGKCVDERGRETTKGKFVSMVCGSLKDAWCSSDTVEEK